MLRNVVLPAALPLFVMAGCSTAPAPQRAAEHPRERLEVPLALDDSLSRTEGERARVDGVEAGAARPSHQTASASGDAALAVDPAGAAEAAPDAAREPFLDASRRVVKGATTWVAAGVNSWFGDRPFEDGGRVWNGRFALRTLWRQDDGFDFNVRFSARLDLPNLRDNSYLFFGRDNERDLISDQPQPFTRQQQLISEDRRDDSTFFVGLGKSIYDSIDFRIGVRGGYKLFTHARYRHDWELSEQDEVRFRQTFFWATSEGFGSTTALDYEHTFDPTLAFRWLNSTTISEDSNDFEWSSSVGMYKSFGDRRLLSSEVLISGETGSSATVGEYGVRFKWQQPFLRDWLIGEVILGHFWPRDDGDEKRDRSWALGTGLTMEF